MRVFYWTIVVALLSSIFYFISLVVKPPALPEHIVVVREPERASQLVYQILDEKLSVEPVGVRRQLAAAITEEAQLAGYDPLLVLSLIEVESQFKLDAVSEKDAMGLMQIRPQTLEYLARRANLKLPLEEIQADSALCVRLGVRYLRDLHERFGDFDLALMAYNAGPRRIRVAQEKKKFSAYEKYPQEIKRVFARMRRAHGQEEDWAIAWRSFDRRVNVQ
ncbi:MAG: lytic transglycosylase domain-containing protein [Proteobacteria bacterium]|nr:lytic transglycosylase domain-containing protein [Cystobacterineae bacterium]MCL2258409.1 lytic transglycosylase domain-containing protein [Cystobacterineae bacterium]MCL2315338.1 lytic transglycosylase domain-containing protein [Pseudomonadota bacterium]